VILRLLIFVILVLGVIGFLYWFKRTPPARVARVLRKVGFGLLIAFLLLAVLTGRLNPLFAALAALVPAVLRVAQVVQLIPALQRVMRSLGIGLPGAAGAGGPGVSSIRTRFLAMRLDHATGVMDGEVLQGPFAGRWLRDLGLDQLLRMLELYRDADGQSAAVLEAYLDREHPADWRDRDPGPGAGSRGGSAAHRGLGAGPMNEAEARAILGVDAAADAALIREAHRRLMQKLHPDRGGSDYLATKINEAKRVLLNGRT
jgi:hypothetical protein